jgi:hypothetical protein
MEDAGRIKPVAADLDRMGDFSPRPGAAAVPHFDQASDLILRLPRPG